MSNQGDYNSKAFLDTEKIKRLVALEVEKEREKATEAVETWYNDLGIKYPMKIEETQRNNAGSWTVWFLSGDYPVWFSAEALVTGDKAEVISPLVSRKPSQIHRN